MAKQFGRDEPVVAPIPRKKPAYARIPLEPKKNGERGKGERKMPTNAGKEGIGEGRFMLDAMLTTLLVLTRVLRIEEVGEGERVQGG